MRAVWCAAVVLVAVAGCGKGGSTTADTASGAPDIDGVREQIILDYRDNPAAADKRYKGKVCRMTVPVQLERRGSETVGRFVLAEEKVYMQFHFRSEDEAAALAGAKRVPTLQGRCVGLKDRTVVFTGTVVSP